MVNIPWGLYFHGGAIMGQIQLFSTKLKRITRSGILTQFLLHSLQSRISKCARFSTRVGVMYCAGNQYYRHDEQLHFRVINYGWNIISLKSLTFPLVDDKFLCVRRDGRLYSDGAMRSNETRFR